MTSPEAALQVLHDAAAAAADALRDLQDWGPSGGRSDQYHSDVLADAAVLEVLDRAGFGVFSEESGLHHPDRPVRVVVDPVDGSTNASRGLPWWATSLCALDEDGPAAAVVVNQVTGWRFEATRGGGARRDGRAVAPTGCSSLSSAIVAFSGYPRHYLGWSQYRSLGAAALDICAVAAGTLDAFIDCAPSSLAPWDYLAAMLICQEAGASVVDAEGRDLVVREGTGRRTVVAAATPALLAEAVAGRRRLDG
ncbi:MAG TPA: inositol monophosphatase family protein [Acidimicrobiales bacterium]|nr:inositol monophosphatase family protein [Acidimicrobiales bacterium]